MRRELHAIISRFAAGLILGIALAVSLGGTEPAALAARARSLHFSSLVVDTHVDTTQRLLDPRFNLAVRDPRGSVDIPRLREGGVGAIFFAAWIPSSVTGPIAVRRATQQIAAVRSQIDKHPKDLTLARTAEEIRAARQAGKIAILLGIEGGQMINSDLHILQKFAGLGVRYMTLTHSGNVEWADSSGAIAKHNGLTPFGKEVVREMNRLGMMVDVSHVSDKTFYDALKVSRAPVIASHSSCRALCDAPRNMTDEMFKALAAKGGVIQINFHVAFLSQKFRDAERRNPQINKAIELEVGNICHGDEACELLEGDRLTRQYVEKGELPRVDWGEIIEHIDHAAKLVGVEHVGLGSDFDGANMPYGMEDAAQLPKITGALLARGYSESDVRKILGENTLRLMTDVARVSAAAHPATQKQ
jgi:membrane dipeptidase